MQTLSLVNILFYLACFISSRIEVISGFSFCPSALWMLYCFFWCIKPRRHHKFQWHYDFAALMPGFEIIHGCMSWEAELGPITRDEKKVIVGCSLERNPLVQRERRYQHSYLIIRPHSEARTPRPGRILKLKEICWHGRRSHSQHKQKNIQINPLGRFKWVLVVLTSNDFPGLLYKAIKGTAEVRNQLHLMLMYCTLHEWVNLSFMILHTHSPYT